MAEFKKLETIGEVVRLIEAMHLIEGEVAKHATTLIGPRNRGSTTTADLSAIPPETPLQEVTSQFTQVLSNGTRCYVVNAPQLEGKINCISLAVALVSDLTVKARIGAHGPELFAEAAVQQAQPTDEIYIITGQSPDGVEVVYTWHPGPPMVVLHPHTAVKLA